MCFGQEPATQSNKIKEYGVGMYSFTNFSLQYRWGNEKRLYRLMGNIGFNGTNGNTNSTATTTQDTLINSTNTTTTKNLNPVGLNCGINFSVLNLKPITDHFGFFWGPSVGVTYTVNVSEKDQTSTLVNNSSPTTTSTDISTFKATTQDIRPNIGIALGVFYNINSSFFIYGEVVPNIYFGFNNSKTTLNETTSKPGTPNIIKNQTDNNSGSIYGLANFANSGAMLTFAYRFSK